MIIRRLYHKNYLQLICTSMLIIEEYFMKKMILTICAALLILPMTSALADMEHKITKQHNNPMTQEYLKAMDDMHKPMMAGVMSSNPDMAFVAGMLPHHQGAIDMAKIELKYGKDPEIRALAEQIIKSQQKEIEFMKKWIEKHQTK